MKRKIILSVLLTLILLLSVLSLTYAFMRPKVEQENVKSKLSLKACAKITLQDTDKVINLKNTYPMDDEIGLKTEPYEFTITSTCENYVGFNMYLTSLTTNQIEDNNIHYAITSMNDTILESSVLKNAVASSNEFSKEELKELDLGIKGTHKSIYKVYSNNVPLRSETSYKLYLWVDKNAGNETMGKSFSAGVSVKSYDRDETMAEYLIANKDNTLIYHDGLPDYEGMENYIEEAEDYSYRFAGASNAVHNYICFGGECSDDSYNENYANLYRIIGLFKNDLNFYEMKIIKADATTELETGGLGIGASHNAFLNLTSPSPTYLGSFDFLKKMITYYWNKEQNNSGNNTNDWSKSNLNNENLNKNFLNYIDKKDSGKWGKMIEEHVWIIAGNNSENIMSQKAKGVYNNEILHADIGTTLPMVANMYKAKIGLMYISDYMYAVHPKYWLKYGRAENNSDSMFSARTYNWLYMGLTEWSITRNNETSDSSFGINSYAPVEFANVYAHNRDFIIRPTMYINKSVKRVSGTGMKNSPYIITYEE